jgi:hypothetical protein
MRKEATMAISTFIVTVHTTSLPGGKSEDRKLAETIKAAMYKTYANPAREDDGITTVDVQPARVHTDAPRSWRVKHDK